MWVPEYIKGFVEEQIYAQYPTVNISEIPDFTLSEEQTFSTTLTTELSLSVNDALPIKTFQSFEVDPLAAITATLAKFQDDEEAWIQLVVKPAAGDWHKRNERYISALRNKSKSGTSGLLGAFWSPPGAAKVETVKLTDYEQTRVSAAEEKSQKLAFQCSLRVVYRGNVPNRKLGSACSHIIASYKQFNTTYLNGFVQKRVAPDLLIEAL